MGTKTRVAPSLTSRACPVPVAAAVCFFFFSAGFLFSASRQRPTSSNSQNGEVGDDKGAAGRQTSRRHLADVGVSDGGFVLQGLGASGENELSHIPFQMVSRHPRAYVFPKFADEATCNAIVDLARTRLYPSGLALRSGESEEGTRDVRTSSGTFLSGGDSSALAWVEKKMAKVTAMPVEHGEAFNVLRYEIGQHYDSHMDVFDPKEYGVQVSNRIASFLLYLTDVEEGGETMFPYEGYHNMDIGYNYKDCIGLKVKPRKGDALLFWSMFRNGTIDPTSLHGSCPVSKGEKWVATKWIRDSPN